MPAIDPTTTRRAKAQITRRYVDASNLDVRVMHGVVYLRGSLGKLRTHPEVDLTHEMEVISVSLRSIGGIRDVVWEVTQRT